MGYSAGGGRAAVPGPGGLATEENLPITTLDDTDESDFIDSGTFGAGGVNIIPKVPTAPVFVPVDGGMTTDPVLPFKLPPDPFVQPPAIVGPLDEEPGSIIIPPPPVTVIPEEEPEPIIIEPPVIPFLPLEIDESDYIDPGNFGIFVPEFIDPDPDDESDYIDPGQDFGIGGFDQAIEDAVLADPDFYADLDFVDLEFADE